MRLSLLMAGAAGRGALGPASGTGVGDDRRVPWPITASRTVYANRWIRVDHEHVIRPDGEPGEYGVVTALADAVFVVAVTDGGQLVLVEVDRHTVGRSLEVPAGGADGDDPLAAARRELREETGYAAREWRHLGRIDALNGVGRAPEHIFLAHGAHPVADAHGQREEGIAAVQLRPLAEVLELVRTGGIRDGGSIAALLLALIHLERIDTAPL